MHDFKQLDYYYRNAFISSVLFNVLNKYYQNDVNLAKGYLCNAYSARLLNYSERCYINETASPVYLTLNSLIIFIQSRFNSKLYYYMSEMNTKVLGIQSAGFANSLSRSQTETYSLMYNIFRYTTITTLASYTLAKFRLDYNEIFFSMLTKIYLPILYNHYEEFDFANNFYQEEMDRKNQILSMVSLSKYSEFFFVDQVRLIVDKHAVFMNYWLNNYMQIDKFIGTKENGYENAEQEIGYTDQVFRKNGKPDKPKYFATNAIYYFVGLITYINIITYFIDFQIFEFNPTNLSICQMHKESIIDPSDNGSLVETKSNSADTYAASYDTFSYYKSSEQVVPAENGKLEGILFMLELMMNHKYTRYRIRKDGNIKYVSAILLTILPYAGMLMLVNMLNNLTLLYHHYLTFDKYIYIAVFYSTILIYTILSDVYTNCWQDSHQMLKNSKNSNNWDKDKNNRNYTGNSISKFILSMSKINYYIYNSVTSLTGFSSNYTKFNDTYSLLVHRFVYLLLIIPVHRLALDLLDKTYNDLVNNNVVYSYLHTNYKSFYNTVTFPYGYLFDIIGVLKMVVDLSTKYNTDLDIELPELDIINYHYQDLKEKGDKEVSAKYYIQNKDLKHARKNAKKIETDDIPIFTGQGVASDSVAQDKSAYVGIDNKKLIKAEVHNSNPHNSHGLQHGSQDHVEHEALDAPIDHHLDIENGNERFKTK